MAESTSAYRRRRARYMEAIGDGAVALIAAPPEKLRNGDVLYPFRQSSDLTYLTGFPEPESVLVLRPGADKPVVMFTRPRDPDRELWDGRRAGIDGAVRDYGADEAYPIDELEDRLPELVANASELHYAVGELPELDRTVTGVIARLRGRPRRGKRPPRRIADPHWVLHEMRLRKDADEIETLRRAAAVTAEAHRAAMAHAAPGVNERELEALVDYTFRRRGGAGPGYGTIVGAGDNATILHYVENSRPIGEGDLVLIDAGCEIGGLTADVTRTFPASGRFSPPQRRLYEVVLAAEEAAIEMARPGVTVPELHERCVEIVTEGLVELGILEGPAADRIEAGDYKRLFPHQTSHWLGMDVHDVGSYTVDGEPRPLEPGMVLTIEPGVYVPAGASAPEEYRGTGIRIEDDVLVTGDGRDVLTAETPKKVEDVEAACGGR